MKTFDVIVIGGSAAGLQTTLTLARGLLNVLCIDSNQPCNRSAHESHNFLGFDGFNPLDIKNTSKAQVAKYPTVQMINDKVENVVKNDNGLFSVNLQGTKERYNSQRIIFASGVDDNIGNIGIKNLEKYWGNSVIQCPYCHGYEFAQKKTVFYSEKAEFIKLMVPTLNNWSKELSVICNEKIFESLEVDFLDKLKENKVDLKAGTIVEAHGKDKISSVTLDNGEQVELDILYLVPPAVVNNKEILVNLGVELDEFGLIKVDGQQNTNVPGIKAAGDCASRMRSLKIATYQGQMAASTLCHDLFLQRWNHKM